MSDPIDALAGTPIGSAAPSAGGESAFEAPVEDVGRSGHHQRRILARSKAAAVPLELAHG